MGVWGWGGGEVVGGGGGWRAELQAEQTFQPASQSAWHGRGAAKLGNTPSKVSTDGRMKWMEEGGDPCPTPRGHLDCDSTTLPSGGQLWGDCRNIRAFLSATAPS